VWSPLFLWGYVKDQVYSQRMNMLAEHKVWLAAATANVKKDILQPIWQDMDYRWEVCRTTDGANCNVFCT
jgi:hypothetical protein